MPMVSQRQKVLGDEKTSSQLHAAKISDAAQAVAGYLHAALVQFALLLVWAKLHSRVCCVMELSLHIGAGLAGTSVAIMTLCTHFQVRTTPPKTMDTSRRARPPHPLPLRSMPMTLLQLPAQQRRLQSRRPQNRQSASRRLRQQGSSATARSLHSRRHRDQRRRLPLAPEVAHRTRRLLRTQCRRRGRVLWGPMRRCAVSSVMHTLPCKTLGEYSFTQQTQSGWPRLFHDVQIRGQRHYCHNCCLACSTVRAVRSPQGMRMS